MAHSHKADCRTASKLCNWHNARDSGHFLLPQNNKKMENDSEDESFYSDDGESSPLRKFKDDFVMASCPSNLYHARGQTDDQLPERSNTHTVLHTVCKAENVLEMMEMQEGTMNRNCTVTPSSIYYIPESTYDQRPAIEVKVKNLSYEVNPKSLSWWQKLSTMQLPWEWVENSAPQQVLNNVSFSVKSGQMLAIMGNSGSGKTTLLDVIACRTEGGLITGDVYLNNVARTSNMVRGCSAYVRQDDRLLPHLTVKETLMFVAHLKLPTTFNAKDIRKRVDNVINELGLSHVADSKVGGAEDRGVSGGERRRVSIGVQLLLDPSVLFLDEPTSGLDSFTAHHLVETLEKLANNNRTVLLSIHQPRSDIFELFDMVLILSKGNMVYNGRAENMVNYFTNLGHPCPSLTNPCDFYVDLATIDPTSEETERTSTTMVSSLVEAYQSNVRSSLSGSQESRESVTSKAEEQWPVLAMFKNLENLPGPLKQFWILYRRSTRNIVEDYGFLLSQFIQASAMSVVIGLVYFNLGLDQSSMRDRFGMMYILGALYPYMIVLDLIGIYHRERSFLYFELEDRLYGITPYYFAKIFSELPFHTFFVAVYCVPVYFLAGFKLDVNDFFIVFGILFLLVYCSRTLAMFAAAWMPTFQLSCFFAQTFFSMYIMSAGFFINLDNIFSGLKWVSSVSYLKWGFQALCKNQISNLTFSCTDAMPGSCIRNGYEALESYSLQGNAIWESCVIMIASCVVYLVLFFIGMRLVPQKPHEI